MRIEKLIFISLMMVIVIILFLNCLVLVEQPLIKQYENDNKTTFIGPF